MELRETTAQDLKQVQALWADGDVMKFVGFPEGLHETDEAMRDWLAWIEAARPMVNHYSIYDGEAYCGEAFYAIDKETKRASLDIKLFGFARGKGLAFAALKKTIEQAFANGAESVWVDPKPQNEKALALYRRLGMEQKETPQELRAPDCPDALYFELRKP